MNNTHEFPDSHATHHVLAVYALGGNAATINAAYGTQIAFQREAIPSPEPITKHNWKEHLQDEKYVSLHSHTLALPHSSSSRYYQAYLAFFTVELEQDVSLPLYTLTTLL